MKAITRKIPANKTVGLFEEILNNGWDLRVRVTGRSMAPFLLGGEILTIRKVPFYSLRRGDLIFFKDSYGNSMVHRIIRKGKDGANSITLQTKGDALLSLDEPVKGSEVLGKVCRIEGTKSFDMETGIWSSANYFLAIVHLMRSRIYLLLGSARSLLRLPS